MIAVVSYAHVSSLSRMASPYIFFFPITGQHLATHGTNHDRDDVTEPHAIRETNKGGAVCDPASLLQKTEKGRSARSRGYAKPDAV